MALELPRGTGPAPSVLGRTMAAPWDNVSRGMFLFESGSLGVAELGSHSSILSSLFILGKRRQFELLPSELMLS